MELHEQYKKEKGLTGTNWPLNQSPAAKDIPVDTENMTGELIDALGEVVESLEERIRQVELALFSQGVKLSERFKYVAVDIADKY